MARYLKIPTHRPAGLLFQVLVTVSLLVGCEGKSLVDSDPVFAKAPPRRSLSNRATVAQTESDKAESVVKTVSYDMESAAPLTGNTVVAEVNGTPIFVDDLIGSVRLALEERDEIPEEQKRRIMLGQIQRGLDRHIEQQIVLQTLDATIPEDRRQLVEDSLTEVFESEVLGKIRKDKGVSTEAELQAVLGEEGLSIELLREAFFRVQKVNGYLSQRATAPDKIDRTEILQFYKENVDQFTTKERVRWQELILKYSYHDGKQQTAKEMLNLIQQLKAGTNFGDLSAKYSDAMSAEKKGDMGWMLPGALADKELEKELWTIPSGQTTKIYERDDQLELYRVVEHQQAKTSTLQEVQHQIEETLKDKKYKESRQKVLDDLKANANVITIFDNEIAEAKPAATPFSINR